VGTWNGTANNMDSAGEILVKEGAPPGSTRGNESEKRTGVLFMGRVHPEKKHRGRKGRE